MPIARSDSPGWLIRSSLLRRAIAACVVLSAVGAITMGTRQVVTGDKPAERDRIVQPNRVEPVLFPLSVLGAGIGLGAGMMYLFLHQSQRAASRSPHSSAAGDRDTALKQDETFYRTILNALPELIIHMHRDGTYLDVKFTNAFPLIITPEDVGKNIRELLPKPIAEQRLVAARQALQTGEIQVYEFPLWVEEQRLWEEIRIVPLNTDEVVVLIRDLTQRQHIEEALRQSEANLLQAQRLAHVGSWEMNLTTQDIRWSEELFRIVGRDPNQSEPTYAELLDMVPVEDQNILNTEIQQAIAHQTSYEVEHRIYRPDGTLRYVINKGQTNVDNGQKATRMYGTVLDITERKQLEQSLRSQAEEERLLTTITQNIHQSLDLEEILATTVVEVQRMLKVDRALIFRLNDDGFGQIIQEAVAPEYAVTGQMRWQEEHFPDRCYDYYSKGLPRIVSDAATDECTGSLTDFMQTAGVKSKIVAPIVKDLGGNATTVWGLLIVHACSHYRQWQDSEAKLLQRICNQLAIAIDQANLYQQVQTELAERKQAEEALQEREEMLRAIGDNLPKGFIYQRVYEPGKGFSYSYVSAGIERLLGLKPEDVLANSSTTRTIGFEEDLARADQVAQESLKNLSAVELQMRNRTATGEIQWSSIRSTPRRLADGRTVWDGVEVDITDLKRVEAALRASEEMFRRAFDNAPFGISLVSTTGYFVKVNPCYCDLLGYTEEELLNLRFQDITHPDDLEVDLNGFQKLVSGELRTFQMEKRYISKQGAPIPVLVNIALIRDQEGQPLYSVGHVQDIRDRQKVERMKNEFISVVSHELRTPLTSIRGALGLIGSGVFDTRPERVKHMLQIAITNSDRLVRLVDDILSLERLQSGKVKLMIEPCEVEELMRQAVEGVQTIADQTRVALSLIPLSETLWAAPDAVIQALTNLLSNAIKFSNAGGTVWLKAEVKEMEHDSDGDFFSQIPSNHSRTCTPCVIFTVTDQGRGIPEDKLDVIFEEFQQVDVSDSRKKGGTGLGLAICKNIVQQHRGKIWVESYIDQGSTFYIALPLATQESHE